MVFTNLPAHEKDAFFSLLDEYFSSRPDLIAGLGGGDHAAAEGATAHGAAASAVHRALASNPEATSKLVSAGLKHGVPKNSPYAAAANNTEVNNAVGRVAAASLAFGHNANANSTPKSPPPPVLPRRTSSNSSPNPDQPPRATSITDRAPPSQKKFGDVDMSSAKNMFTSLRSSTANKSYNPPPPTTPAAFTPKKNAFAPPPVRRVTSESSPTPPPRTPQVEEPQGEWAEALYDYDSDDPGDLQIRANERVLVTERSSDDWWTGEYGGKKGLFPASYVRIL